MQDGTGARAQVCSFFRRGSSAKLLSVSASRGHIFRRYLLNGVIDEDRTQALGVHHATYFFFVISSYNNKKKTVFPLSPNVKKCVMVQ